MDATAGGAKSHALAGGNVRWLPDDERRERDRRFTPSIIRDPYRALVGDDFVDVATEILPDGDNPMKAPHALTEADDGITADWGPLERPAFCNKPFRLRAPFLARCLREAALGRHVTYLETNDIGTFVAQTALRHCQDLIACDGRPNYGKPNGDIDKHPTFGTILYGIVVRLRTNHRAASKGLDLNWIDDADGVTLIVKILCDRLPINAGRLQARMDVARLTVLQPGRELFETAGVVVDGLACRRLLVLQEN
jgi:hypothetical protein